MVRKAPKILSLKQTIEQNKKSMDYLSKLSPNPNADNYPRPKQLSSAKLFESEKKSRAKKDAPKENVIKMDTLKYLRMNPKVKWRCRINSGTVQIGKSYVSFNTMPGISDIIGMLVGGRFLAIETKRIGEKATEEQQKYIDMVNAGGGLAFVAYTLDDVIEKIESA